MSADPSIWFTAEEIAQSRAYWTVERRINAVIGVVDAVVLIALVGLHFPPWVTRTVGGPWPLQLIAVVVAMQVVTTLVGMPAQIGRWRHAKAFGRSVESGRSWLRDLLVNAVVSAIASAALLLPVWVVIRSTDQWWLLAWATLMVGGFVLRLLYPVVLLPLFNRFTPLDNDRLRRRLLVFTREAGVRATNVFVEDSSRRTTAHNAYVAGVGRTRRIVLTDTLLSSPPEQIEFVLAHELSHVTRWHGWVMTLFQAVVFFPAFAGVAAMLSTSVVLAFVGVDSAGDPAAVPAFTGLLVAFLVAAGLAQAWLERAIERIADRDALNFSRDADAAEGMLRSFAAHAQADLDPSPWTRLRSTHPPLAERLDAVARWRDAQHVALVFTDIVDSTRLTEEIGDLRFFELLQEHDHTLRELARQRGGRVLEHTGDGLIVEFADAGTAVLWARDAQQAIAEVRNDAGDRLHIRAGIHLGDVIRHAGTVFGRDVNFAARVGSSAQADEIVVSEEVYESLRDAKRFEFAEGREVDHKGIGVRRVYGVLWSPGQLVATS
ncbi:MAG: endopeptidase [Actinomycetota bacterium]|jgi:STE24 endopeptidase